MRNKKSLLSLGLLALVLVLGVGYAAINATDLKITGTAATGDVEDMAVKFTSVKNDTVTPADGTTNANLAVDATIGDGLIATIDVTGMSAVGDKAVATYVITNSETDLDALITKVKATGSDYFKVTTSLDAEGANVTAAANGGTAEVTVTVELVKTPIDADDSSAEITVELLASPVAQ